MAKGARGARPGSGPGQAKRRGARPARAGQSRSVAGPPAPATEQVAAAPRRTWLDGPPPRTDGYPGDRLRFPQHGRGSVAGQGPKLGAFVLDLLMAGLLTLAIARPGSSHDRYVANLVSDGVFVLLTAGALVLSGRTLGMRVLGLQVVRLDGARMGWRSLPRQILCGLLVPALIVDRDRRALYDRLLGTVVVHVR